MRRWTPPEPLALNHARPPRPPSPAPVAHGLRVRLPAHSPSRRLPVTAARPMPSLKRSAPNEPLNSHSKRARRSHDIMSISSSSETALPVHAPPPSSQDSGFFARVVAGVQDFANDFWTGMRPVPRASYALALTRRTQHLARPSRTGTNSTLTSHSRRAPASPRPQRASISRMATHRVARPPRRPVSCPYPLPQPASLRARSRCTTTTAASPAASAIPRSTACTNRGPCAINISLLQKCAHRAVRARVGGSFAHSISARCRIIFRKRSTRSNDNAVRQPANRRPSCL